MDGGERKEREGELPLSDESYQDLLARGKYAPRDESYLTRDRPNPASKPQSIRVTLSDARELSAAETLCEDLKGCKHQDLLDDSIIACSFYNKAAGLRV